MTRGYVSCVTKRRLEFTAVAMFGVTVEVKLTGQLADDAVISSCGSEIAINLSAGILEITNLL